MVEEEGPSALHPRGLQRIRRWGFGGGLGGHWVSRAHVDPWDPAQKEPGLTAAQHLDCSERRDIRAEDRDIWG